MGVWQDFYMVREIISLFFSEAKHRLKEHNEMVCILIIHSAHSVSVHSKGTVQIVSSFGRHAPNYFHIMSYQATINGV
jgi:hypothetical protein